MSHHLKSLRKYDGRGESSSADYKRTLGSKQIFCGCLLKVRRTRGVSYTSSSESSWKENWNILANFGNCLSFLINFLF